jgi:hypothetical protein
MLYEAFRLFFSPFVSCLTTFVTKAGPLSDQMEMGVPYLGIIYFNKAQTTFWVFSAQVGRASTHPEKVHTITRRYLSFLSEVIILHFLYI